MEIGILLAVCVLLFVMGALMLVGKGDFLIKCLKRPEAEKYNLGRVRLLNALKVLVTILFTILCYFVKGFANPEIVIWISLGCFFVVVGALEVMERTWAKR